MKSILSDRIAFDTNVWIFALRGTEDSQTCRDLIGRYLRILHIYLPLQVTRELNRNLTKQESNDLFGLLALCDVEFGLEMVDSDSIRRFEELGTKKGDAYIAAELSRAHVPWLVSENRHFLAEVPDLPFSVITAQQALNMIGSAHE